MTYLKLTSVLDCFAVLLFLAAIRAIRDYRRRGGLPYPPGPRPLPIVGNVLDIPKHSSWLAYSKFSKIYGDILSFQLFGQVIIVLNTAKVAKDLLEKRAAIYSDRPVFPLYEMMGWDWPLPTSNGNYWRQGRKMLDRGLRSSATASYQPIMQAKVHVLLSRLLENPNQWEAHINRFQGELILAVTYGHQKYERDDTEMLLAAFKRRNQFASSTINPGSLLLNHIPLLRYIPDWLPWISYKLLIRLGIDLGNQVLYPPLRRVKESMLQGMVLPSLALENLQELENMRLSGPDRDKAERMIAGVLASMYSAGLDTSASALRVWFMAMSLYPDIQKRAQDEVDSVTGRVRLPTLEDRPNLRFVDAVCKEVLRWRPVAPAGVPHSVTRDDIYADYFIPKGAVVIGNIWSILQDPALYPEPDVFKPERFLNPDGSLNDDPVLTSVFGFGKRICPGRFFADATLFIVIASLLSVFKIEKDGNKLSGHTFQGSLVSGPNSFPCSLSHRDSKAEEVIHANMVPY